MGNIFILAQIYKTTILYEVLYQGLESLMYQPSPKNQMSFMKTTDTFNIFDSYISFHPFSNVLLVLKESSSNNV